MSKAAHSAPERPTPFPRLNEVLAALVTGVSVILGNRLLSACLQGSFAIGDFNAFSDVDFALIVADTPSDGEVEALQEFHATLFRHPSPWAQHLEGSYFPAGVVGDLNRAGEELWYLDNGSSQLVRSAHCNTLVVRWVLRHYGISLAGRHPRELVYDVPRNELRQEIRGVMRGWAGEILANREAYYNRFYQGFIVLSYCRMLRDLAEGDTGSKQAGARWFKARYPGEWDGLIDRAWATRPLPEWQVRQAPDPGDFESTMRFVEHCLGLAQDLPG